MKKLLPVFFFFVLLSFVAVASSNTQYLYTGYADGNYITGSGIFNSANPSFNPSYTGAGLLTQGNYSAVVGEIDNDGLNEIIVQDKNIIKIYRLNTLELDYTYTLPVSARYTNVQLFDINGDGKNEIIVGATGASPIVYILEKKGGAILLNQTYNIGFKTAIGYNVGDMQIKCGAVNDCIVGIASTYSSTSGGRTAYAYFNWTNYTDAVQYGTGTYGSGYVCAPKISSVPYVDYDASGQSTYVFSWFFAELGAGNHDEIFIDYVRPNSTNYEVGRQEIKQDLGDVVMTGNSCGDIIMTSGSVANHNGAKTMFTNPIVFDMIGGTSSGAVMQTAIGYMTGLNDAHIKVYDSTGAVLSTFPTAIASQFHGTLLGNLMKVNILPSGKSGAQNKNTEVCMVAYDTASGGAYMPCGSEMAFVNVAPLVDLTNLEFILNANYNFTTSSQLYNSMSHVVDMSTNTIGQENDNPDEILWANGIQEFQQGNIAACTTGGILNAPTCPTTTIYNFTKKNAMNTPIDLDASGRDDIIQIHNNAVWYLDDGFQHATPVISAYSVNPCVNSVWQENTSVITSVTPTTSTSENIQARAQLYYNTPNEIDSGWSANYSTGTAIPFTFTANKSVTSATLRLSARNSLSVNQTANVDLSISVGSTGVVLGDCETSIILNTSTTNEAATLARQQAVNRTGNIITSGLDTINTKGHLGLGVTALYLIFMIILAIWVITAVHNTPWGRNMTQETITLILIVFEALAFMVGIYIGVFGVGAVMVVAIIGIVVIIVWVKNKGTSQVLQQR